MVSHAKKKSKNGMSRKGRKRRAESRRAKEESGRAIAERRERRLNAFKAFGKRAAAALFVCGALAMGVNSNDNRADFSGREKPDAKVSQKKEDAGGEGFGKITEVFLPIEGGNPELILTSNDYSEGWTQRQNPWANARPLLDGIGNAGMQNSEGETSGDGKKPDNGVGRGSESEKGKGGKSPKEKPKPWRIDWDHLDALPANPRRKFSMDLLEPEDEEGEENRKCGEKKKGSALAC